MNFREQISQSVSRCLTQMGIKFEQIKLEHPTLRPPQGKPDHGDYSTNIAMVVHGQKVEEVGQVEQGYGAQKLAEEIVKRLSELRELSELVERIEAVKPGFINFRLSQKALLSLLDEAIKKGEEYGKLASQEDVLRGQKIVLEHTSPNTNKPLHVGHIRNNVLSMAMIRILEFVGNEVVPVEVINDRGAHIMQSIWGYLSKGKNKKSKVKNWTELLQEWANNPSDWKEPKDAEEKYKKPDHFVGYYYVLAEKLKTEKVKQEIQEMLVEWEAENPNLRKLWKQMNGWFYDGVKDTYERLGSLDSEIWYESDIYREGKDIVEENIGKTFSRQDDGAVIANLEKYKLPNCIVLRKDGTSIYMTQDLALLKARKEKHKADKFIYVVANEQALHFDQLFVIARDLGWEELSHFKHLAYGMVRLTSGAMSSRLGTVVQADDLMDQAKARAQRIIDSAKISRDVGQDLSETVGLGAIKYTILKYSYTQDMVFDPKTSISFEGDSGPYLQYTYARTQSVLSKIKKRTAYSLQRTVGKLEPEELEILRHFYKFPEVIEAAALQYSPNLLCNFLFELAQKYNGFYNKHRILGEVGELRVGITKATGQILKTGLNLLGIQAPDRM